MALFLGNRDLGTTDELGHNLVTKKVFGAGFANDLTVKQDNPRRMGVVINNLYALIQSRTDRAIYEAFQTSADEIDLTNSDPSNPRIDALVVYIDLTTAPDPNEENNPNLSQLAIIPGIAEASPTAPTTSSINANLPNSPWLRLANIEVGAGVSTIRDTDITRTDSVLYPGQHPDAFDIPDNSIDLDAKGKASTIGSDLFKAGAVDTHALDAGAVVQGKLSNRLQALNGWLSVAGSFAPTYVHSLGTHTGIPDTTANRLIHRCFTIANSTVHNLVEPGYKLRWTQGAHEYNGVVLYKDIGNKVYIFFCRRSHNNAGNVTASSQNLNHLHISRTGIPQGFVTDIGAWEIEVISTATTDTDDDSHRTLPTPSGGHQAGWTTAHPSHTGYHIPLPRGSWDVRVKAKITTGSPNPSEGLGVALAVGSNLLNHVPTTARQWTLARDGKATVYIDYGSSRFAQIHDPSFSITNDLSIYWIQLGNTSNTSVHYVFGRASSTTKNTQEIPTIMTARPNVLGFF